MSGYRDRKRIGHHLPCASLVLIPGGKRKRDPHRASVNQEFDVHRVGVAGRHSHNQSLINAVHLLLTPAIVGLKVAKHGSKTIPNAVRARLSARLLDWRPCFALRRTHW